MLTHLPEGLLPVTLLAPAADAGGRSSNFVSVKGAHRAFLVCYINQGNAATIALTPNQASDVAGTGAKVISATRIWTNLDMAADSDFTQQTSAANYTTDAGVKVKCVIFEIGRECLDLANNFDCIRVTTGASNAANITSALLLVDQGYKGAIAAINPLVD
jgi:hypothetical protein